MSKNYMPEIAEMLGVEIGEKFKVVHPEKGILGTYYLTNGGIARVGSVININDVLLDILLGYCAIEKESKAKGGN